MVKQCGIPQKSIPFTMQIGDMNLLAAKTGITVVGDLRRKDMAFGWTRGAFSTRFSSSGIF